MKFTITLPKYVSSNTITFVCRTFLPKNACKLTA